MAKNEIVNPNTDLQASSVGSLYQDACLIIDQAQQVAYRAINETLIKRNWLLGMRIQHEVLKDQRAEYGEQVVGRLADNLTGKYGKGFIKRNLWHFVDFYVKHPDFFQAVSYWNYIFF